MSGGHFDYRQYALSAIADDIDHLVGVNGKLDKDGWGHDYPPDIIARFRETAIILRRAAAMVQRVDWLVSCDDGEDSFRRRWEEEVPRE